MNTLRILISLFLPSFFLFSCSISFNLSVAPYDQTDLQSQCLDDQRFALLQLQHDLYYTPNFTFSSKFELWDLNIDCCTWKGVTCDALGHVIGVDLSYKNLSGSFHSIFNLHHLQSLNLAGNNFNTTLFQYEFGKLQNLTHLNLSDSCFHGQIPIEISYLTRLVSLDLSNQDYCCKRNDQSVNICDDYYPTLKLEKPNFKTLIKNMKSLKRLYLDRVDISTQSTKWCETTSLLLPKLSILSMSYCGLTGPLCSSLSSLHYLSELSLGGNPISILPSKFLKNFSLLVSLNLENCNLSGHFSSTHSSLFSLPSLRSLHLEHNQLVGEIDEFPNASSSLIEDLSFGYNSFSFVKLDIFSQFKNLRLLDLSNMSLLIENDDGCLTFPQLESLYLKSCNLTGFPAFLKSQENLKYLDLSNNKISGAVPNWVWQKSLQYLDLSKNSLSSLDHFSLNQSLTSSQDSLQTHICNLSQLRRFNASYNKLNGSIPSCFGNISTLRNLDLQQNNFSGRIPDFAKATQLDTVQLNENKLEGKLPRSLANCTMLRVLNLGNNTLSDTFPLWLGKLPSLKVLILRANRFYGLIKHLKNNFPVLDVLDIAFNNFSGQLSIEFFQATHELRSLKINGNKLEGRLPRSLANCKMLEVLDLGKNMIQDTFPFWLEKLPSLKVLVLRGNRFCGAIKVSGDENGFPMLRILDLASNNFSGELPVRFFQSLRGMKMMMTDGNKANAHYIGEEDYQDSVTIVNKGFEIFYKKILTIFACLDISNNSFHGRIPEEIQNIKSIKMLNLSYNSFFGHIPISLGSLTELESLDLSQNELFGKIPPQLTSLTFLEVLNLSYNQLEGSIPQSYQFGTFSNDSYKGNPRLCGLPLTRKCNEVCPRMPPPVEDVDTWIDRLSDWQIVLIGYGCGLGIGLCIGYTMLNELENRWVDSLTQNRKRKRRRSR